MAKQRQDLDWITVDTANMGTAVATAFNAYVSKRSEVDKLRLAFEDKARKAMKAAGQLEEGQTVLFAYRFGKVAIAYADADQAPRRSESAPKLVIGGKSHRAAATS